MSPELDLAALVKSHLTPEEVSGGMVYAAEAAVPAGTHLDFPKIHLDVPWEAFLVFVDREPTANWSHSCRYLLVGATTNEIKSIEAQLPPFGRGSFQWRVLYRAPSVPEALSSVSQSSP
jgi:hypothetical protein